MSDTTNPSPWPGGWAEFRAEITAEIAAKRPHAAAEDRGSLLLPQRIGWKPPKVKQWRGKKI